MRARDNRHRADELAAVVRWLRGQADDRLELAGRLRGINVVGDRLAEGFAANAMVLRETADRLERGEHHAPV